jgi:hypothetical protein
VDPSSPRLVEAGLFLLLLAVPVAEWSLRTSLALQPWRLSASEKLATELALDGRAGDRPRRRMRARRSPRPWSGIRGIRTSA